jgi:nitrate reductase NapA
VSPRPQSPDALLTMGPVDRRTFLKGVAIATAGTALTVRDATAIEDGAVQRGLEWKKAPCRLCGVGCGLLVAIQNGRAVGVKGDPDSPVSRGLACVKGYHSVQALYGRDRIRRAMIRRSGRLVDVPMREALDLVARRIRETAEQHGSDSVGLYGSAQWSVIDAYVAAKLFRGSLGSGSVDTSARLHTASAAAGLESTFGMGGSVGCYADIEQADVFVLWNINMAETDPVLFSRLLARRAASPAVRIIDLTTRTSRTSYASDRSLLYAPHAELAIGNAICQELIARQLVDREFVERYVAFKQGKTDIGFGLEGEPLSADDASPATLADYVKFLSAYTPERVQQLSGVSADSIRWVASLYGDRSRKVMSLWGSAVNQHVRGTWINNVLYNIHLLTGRVGSPGNGPLCLTGQPNGGLLHDGGALAGTLPRGMASNEEDRRRAAGIWDLPPERIPRQPARGAVALFRALERGDIRFLWVQGTNPMVSLPNLRRYRRAVAGDDRFIVVSEAYPTPTTDIADVVLPAALWIEREGVYVNSERRVQHFAQLVRPPGDAMSDAWQMIEVARRLGYSKEFAWEESRHVDLAFAEYGRFVNDSQRAFAPLSELRAQPGVIWPTVNGEETRWRYGTAHDPAADPAHGAFDFYGHADHRAWIWLRPYDPPAESPDRQFPFWFGTGKVLEHWGSGAMTQRIPTLHRAMPHAYVEINRDDAKALGIGNGEQVRLVSRRGSLEIEARIDYRGQPPRGTLFAPSFDEGALVNLLTLDACCPISGQPDYGKCAVRVERLTRNGAA